MKILYITFIFAIFLSFSADAQLVKNFTVDGTQITKFDKLGRAIDAHDGEIAYFNNTYYLYGTSYDCGFEWNNKTAPFCGFKCYSSKDMVNWKDEGFLFDAQTKLWQTRCDGKTYGCFRPHVVYNKRTKNYVLWINVYDNVSGYRVFTGKTPTGPFIEVAEPKIAVNATMPPAGLNNGDHDLFIDDDGTGYLAFTDWRTNGTIVVEQLTADYLSGTGKVTKGITSGQTEAPALFKRNGIYYITYSDPNCGYCSATGTSYKTAASPMGPWSEGKKISDNSCGGQPSFVSTMKINGDNVYLYGSDLWNNAAKNEALANYYWAPLTFAADGAINKMDCLKTFAISRENMLNIYNIKTVEHDFTAFCDINKTINRAQTFTANKTGKINAFTIATAKSGYPTSGLELKLYEISGGKLTFDKPLAVAVIPGSEISWAVKNVTVPIDLPVTKDKQYAFVLSSASAQGCYGFAYNDAYIDEEVAFYSNNGGTDFNVEFRRKLKFEFVIN